MDTTLPTPTGSYAVGRSIYAWADDAQTDALAPLPGTKRELVAWIWYPASAQPSSVKTAEYLPAAWRIAFEREGGTLISQFLTRDLSRVHGHSVRDAEISPQQTAYPVVILRAGLAALTAEYSTLAEDLASDGYVVVGFDAPYRTAVVVFPDGRMITRTAQNDAELYAGHEQDRVVNKLLAAWTADIGFALDQLQRLNAADPGGKFAGRLDLQRVGIVGHSLGGATAAQFCHDDSRCTAGIDIDGAPYGSVIREGLQQPFMFLLSDHGAASDADARQIDANIQSIYERLPADTRLRIMIRGANHFGFSDGVVSKSQILLRLLQTLGLVHLDGRRQLAITAYCVERFFDAHLKQTSGSAVNIQSRRYPEIEIREQDVK